MPPTTQQNSSTQDSQNFAGMDMAAINMARAIRQTESGGDYNAVGKSGETGAYQWTAPTWKEHASQILGDPNAPMTQANQNAVAYGVIKSWKDEGLNAAEIAAKWNSGSSTDWQNKVGTNAQGVHYDIPAYVKSVTDAYQTIKAGGNVGTDPNNPSSITQSAPPSVGGFVNNAFSSAGNLIGGLANVVAHPIKTIEGIGNLAVGTGEALSNSLGLSNFNNPQIQAFHAVKSYFGDRYGGNSLSQIVDHIGHTLYTDPVGAALDLSTFLDGVGGAVGAIGKVSDVAKATELAKATDFISTASGLLKSSDPAAIEALRTNGTLSKIADSVKTISDYVNPITAVGKGAKGLVNLGGKVGGEALGVSTGAGYGAIKGAFNAGSEGGAAQSAFRAGISGGETTGDALVQSAQDAFQSVKQDQSSLYQSQLENIKTGTHTLSDTTIAPVYAKYDELLKKFDITKNADGTLDFSNSRLASEPSSMTDIQQISKEIDKYRNGVKDLNPANIDHLKQFIADRYSAGTRGSAFTTPLADSVRTVLKTNVPKYEEMTSAYAQTASELKDFKSLSLGGKAGKETIIRKLTNTMRGNNEFRQRLLQELENKSGSNLVSQASGVALSPVIPQGLIKYAEILVTSFHISPAVIAALPFESPRLVGEFVNALGKGNAGLTKIGDALIKYKGPTALKVGTITNKAIQK